jgi:sterol desaturase/sphingolipid hydroxylase (fatty acid hydroxylase superfamily)
MSIPDFDLAASAQAWLRTLPGLFTDAASPFWWPSLVLAGLAGVAMAWLAGARHWREVPRRLFPHDRRTALRELPVDLACFLAGSALPFLLGPLMFLLSWCGMAAGLLLLSPLTGFPAAGAPAPGWGLLLAAALVAWGFGDVMLYWTHRLFHRVPLFWRAHRLHHAPEVLTPLTGFRFWPQEHLVHISGSLLGQGFGLGIVAALAGARVPAMDLLGVNLFSLVWGTAFAHLRHSHVPLPYPRWLSFVLVSPHMHQVHHSEEARHHDRNFGTALAVWDWLFGTLYIPAREERFRFGLGEPAAAPAPAPTVEAPPPAANAAAEAAPVRPAA